MKSIEFKGDLKGFPVEVVEKMLERQVEEGNPIDVTVFEKDKWSNADEGGFNWGNTKEGHDFWKNVIYDRNFNLFFERYPKKDDLNTDFIDEFFKGLDVIFTHIEVNEDKEKANFYEKEIKGLILKLEKVKDYLQNEFETHTEFSEGVKYGKTSVITDLLIDLNLILGQGQLKNN